MTELAVIHDGGSLAVHDQCEMIERWAAECQSVPELRDAGNRLAAIDEYLQRTTIEGRSRVAAAMRRLEVRIGELLGPAKVGRPAGETSVATNLSPDQRHDFREMAAHPDVVEKVIEESTDEDPASRRKIQEAIAQQLAKRGRHPDGRPMTADELPPPIPRPAVAPGTTEVCPRCEGTGKVRVW